MSWGIVLVAAILAVAAVYAYAAAALWTHARLSRLAPPRSLAGALALGALVPACGCTALALARRTPAPLRAPLLVAAYSASALLVAAAWLLSGPLAALAVLALALVAAALARAIPAGHAPRARLDDLLLRRDGSPLRDAGAYLAPYGGPALAVGALVGMASLAWPWVKGLAFAALAVALAAPRADVAQDHGAPFARRVFAIHAGFALSGGVIVGALA